MFFLQNISSTTENTIGFETVLTFLSFITTILGGVLMVNQRLTKTETKLDANQKLNSVIFERIQNDVIGLKEDIKDVKAEFKLDFKDLKLDFKDLKSQYEISLIQNKDAIAELKRIVYEDRGKLNKLNNT